MKINMPNSTHLPWSKRQLSLSTGLLMTIVLICFCCNYTAKNSAVNYVLNSGEISHIHTLLGFEKHGHGETLTEDGKNEIIYFLNNQLNKKGESVWQPGDRASVISQLSFLDASQGLAFLTTHKFEVASRFWLRENLVYLGLISCTCFTALILLYFSCYRKSRLDYAAYFLPQISHHKTSNNGRDSQDVPNAFCEPNTCGMSPFARSTRPPERRANEPDNSYSSTVRRSSLDGFNRVFETHY